MGEPDSIIGLPSGTTMRTVTANSILRLIREDDRFDVSWILGLGMYLHHNRFVIAERFMFSNRPWLLFVDSDMVFEPKDIWALYDVANGKPGVYGGIYIGDDGNLCSGPFDEDDPGTFRPLGDIPDRPVRGMTTLGLTLVHRDVLQAIGKNMFQPYGKSISEDVAFCSRARDSGFTPWIVPGCQPGHFKELILYPDGRQVAPVAGAG